ncbi:MAG TPA: rod shape-determining protein MreC [Chitinophagaceae bacterium]|nr:rod shape-determining protein MreC [Chitinophagaceae bacterium]MCB9055387.1 rod shape-determining protein MreC [Chitinophagales bacterium]HRX93183.1 rod shape-determining protein MreC [Chitinophagaceae bacterium]
MRNIFLFISRYRTFFTFLILQVVALWFLFNYNRFHRTKFLGIANEITGRINTQYNKVEDYFAMKAENQRLNRLNDSLMNLLPQNFDTPDTSYRLVKDSVAYDTTGRIRQYVWRDAKVIYNTINFQKNYIQLNRGANQGVRDNMSVISSDGSAVGVVVNVSPNYSVVMSLLHVQSKRSVLLKRTGSMGIIEWDGKNPHYLVLRNIPRSDSVVVGDTVLTNVFSEFPPGFMVGRVAEVVKDKGSNFHILKIRPSANFFSLQQVHVVEKLHLNEQKELLEATRKKIDDPKNFPG